MHLLARNLDGAGPLRTVSPTLVVRRWEGRADRTSATHWRGALAQALPCTGRWSERVQIPCGSRLASSTLRGVR